MIISDQGREFINTITDEIFKKTKTKHQITSAYHPQVMTVSYESFYSSTSNSYNFLYFVQANGLTERLNQTLGCSLSKLVNEDHDDWDQKLDSVLFVYHASKQKSTGYLLFI